MITKSAVALAVKTEGVPSGAAATIEISDGVAPVKVLGALEVRGDKVVTATGAVPVWARETDEVKAWAMGTYTYKVDIAYKALTLTSGPLKLISLVGDRGDPDLRAEQEMKEILEIIEKVPGFLACVSTFDKDATVGEWENKVGNAYAYHHVSHGNLRCHDHTPRRAYAGNDRRVVPAYPWCCQSQADLIGVLNGAYDDELEAAVVRDAIPSFTEVMKQFLKHDDGAHHLQPVFQWVGAGDSSTDVAMGVAELTGAGKWPTCLAFLDSCMLGWDKGLARLFIDKGTRYVIAFRCRVVGGDGAAFAREFYTEWAKQRFDAGGVEAIFKAASEKFPRAEPCLFSAAGIARRSCSGKVRDPRPLWHEYAWDSADHYIPRYLEDSAI